MKIAFQGEHGAYSEVAGKHLFGSRQKLIPMEYFEGVFRAVESGEVQRGVIPIENSLAGSIHINYDLLQKYKLQIVSETHLRVEHVLLCHPQSNLKKIKELWSHPQALAQCSHFFEKHPKIIPKAFYDTAGSAKYIAEHHMTDIGAIASVHAAKIYGLKSLKRNLENNHQNYTRFLGISRKKAAKIKGAQYKTSIAFAPKKNQSGILFKMLEIFASRKINLFKIESRPFPDRAFEYFFYLDFFGHSKDKMIAEALKELKKVSVSLLELGTYPIGGKIYLK